MQSRLVLACAVLIASCFFHLTKVRGQTVAGDTLRGAGAFASGAGWYNLRTAKSNAINVEAMRNYNPIVFPLIRMNETRYRHEQTAK